MKRIVVRQLSNTYCVTGLSNKVPNPTRMGIYANGERSRTIHVQHERDFRAVGLVRWVLEYDIIDELLQSP